MIEPRFVFIGRWARNRMEGTMSYIPREKHREMILDPMRWPHLVLPIKRYRDGMMETALLNAGFSLDEKQKLTIKTNTTIFGPLPGEQDHVTYDNVDALLDDGWVVD